MLTADAGVVVSGAAGAGGTVKVETVVESKADGSVIVKVGGWSMMHDGWNVEWMDWDVM